MKHLKIFETFFSIGDMEDRNIISKQLYQQSENKPNMTLIATNESNWSWEYDSIEKIARLFVFNNSKNLFLEITEMHTKSGIGAGIDYNPVTSIDCGTLQKPELSLIRSTLKQFTTSKSSAGKGFSAKWKDINDNELALNEIINNYNSTFATPTITKSEEITKSKSKNIELVPYSDKAFALFGSGTIDYKYELAKIGGRYNRWLVDPRNKQNIGVATGTEADYLTKKKQTRPGWIFSNSKLAMVKELIGENYKFTQEDIFQLKQYINSDFTSSDVFSVFPQLFEEYFDIIIDDADLNYIKSENPENLEFDFAEATSVYCQDYNDDNYYINFLKSDLENKRYKSGASNLNFESLEENGKAIYNILSSTGEDSFYILLEKNLNPVEIERKKFAI